MSLLIPEGDSLVTYYMLPLVGLNKKSFGNTFKDSFIGQDGLKVYVELKSNMITPSYKSNPNYITEMVFKGKLIILFTVPSRFLASSRLFVQGMYSQMSKEAKSLIYATSTLPYNKTMGSFSVSHPVLQALDKTKTLRSYLHDILGMEKLSNSDELIDQPHESWFIEHRIKDEQKVSN